MLDKTFDPATIEPRITALWEEAEAFKAMRPERAGADPWSIVIPPPNVTGALHMGHALDDTLQDILARYHRMTGKDVLWQPGMDHAGIATQMVVERQMAEDGTNVSRRDMGREAFVERVWQWKAESGGMILNQLRRLGASCDWSRERFTMDEGLSEAVRKIFVQMYDEGLIYRDKRLVNWDPHFQTAISDLEVEQKEVDGHMWRFAYPLSEMGEDGKLRDIEVEGVREIVIATTRPETMLGDGAVAVHPSDERYTTLIGRTVRLPVANRLIPIIADEYPDPEFGSGAVKITGAHDFNDFEVARRNDIPLIVLMDEQARMVATPDNKVPERYAGVDRFEARRMVIAEIEAEGLARGVEDKVIAQPFGDRSGTVIEPMLMDQWYVNAAELARPAMAAVREGRTRFTPASWEKTYFNWMENIQPWCISRQLWWGHRIPAWYGPDGTIFVAADEAGAAEKARAHYGEDAALTRDEDVLDTWFSSGLWPFSTLGWPDEDDPAFQRFYPTNTLVTGFDIIFFWVARMMMMGLYATGRAPFADVYIHALVRDEAGQKMSKSKGNVIDPLDLIDEYGADALRFTLCAMESQGRDIKMSASRVEGYRNFSTKLWNAVRFAEMNGCARDAGFDPENVTLPVNRWLVAEARAAIESADAAIEAYRFNDLAGAIYRFTWNTFCDWYVELIKPVLNGEDGPEKAECQVACAWARDVILKLLHPVMPFVTEELWQRLAEEGGADAEVLCLSAWPVAPQFDDRGAAAEMGWLIALVSAIRSVRSEMNIPPGAKLPLAVTQMPAGGHEWLTRQSDTLSRLARLETVEMVDTAPAGAIQIVVGDCTASLRLAGHVDLKAEKARLTKEDSKLEGEEIKLTKKLSNEAFLAKAPDAVVAEQRARLEDIQAKRATLRMAAERLSGL